MDTLRLIWTWVQNNSGGLSILLSLAGFALLWRQTYKARTAAESARLASDRAIRAISDTDTISDLATIKSGMKRIQVALHGSRYETALLQSQSLRETLNQLRSRRSFGTDERGIRIQSMVAYLKKLQDLLERKLEEPESHVAVRPANNKLSDYTTEVSAWMEQVRFLRGGSDDD